MWIILPPDTNGITDYIQVVLRDRWELLYSALIALFSAATLLSARNSYDIGISLLSAGCQAALYCLVIRQKDHIIGKTDEECGKERSAAVEEEHVSFISFLESVSWRVAITLAVLIAVRPSEPGPLLELGACAIYKAAYWIALLLLVRSPYLRFDHFSYSLTCLDPQRPFAGYLGAGDLRNQCCSGLQICRIATRSRRAHRRCSAWTGLYARRHRLHS